jgi:hypothetical protein
MQDTQFGSHSVIHKETVLLVLSIFHLNIYWIVYNTTLSMLISL